MKTNDRIPHPFPPLRYRLPYPDSMNPQRPAAWEPSSPPKLQTIEAKARIVQGTLDKTLGALTLSGKAEVTFRPAKKRRKTSRRVRTKSHSTDALLSADRALTKRRLRRAPGSVLYDAAEFLFSKKTFERIVQQNISDLRINYFDALSQGRTWQAKWIRIRDTIGLFKALGLFSVVHIFKAFRIAK